MNNGTVVVNNLRNFISNQLNSVCDEAIASLIIQEVNNSFDSVSADEYDDYVDQLLDMLVEFDNDDVPNTIREVICEMITFYEDN
jgi:hypothetical protein